MEFWREMYEASVASKRREHAVAMWYKRRAREAERKRKQWQNAVVGIGLAICCAACVASWVMMIAG